MFTLQRQNPYSSIRSLRQRLTEEQTVKLQESCNEIYQQFLGIVAEGEGAMASSSFSDVSMAWLVLAGRGMTIGQVDAIAQGKIYTGNQALGLGLVDQIGTLQTAVEKVVGSPAWLRTCQLIARHRRQN